MTTDNKKNIRIHKDYIENLDDTNKKLEASSFKAHPTGLRIRCKVVNRDSIMNPICRAMGLPRTHYMSFLFTATAATFFPTRCFIMFIDKATRAVFLQPVPAQYLNATHIMHISERRMPFSRFVYRAPFNGCTPAQLFYTLGIDPLTRSIELYLEEWRVADQHLGETSAFKLSIINPDKH